MSERRQLALLLAGLVALVAVGVVGASLFPEACSDLEQLGELDLRFTDAEDALPLGGQDGADLEAVGERTGIGQWRGAVALPDDATVSRSEFGFFITTDEAFTVLRPSLGIASAARGRDSLDVVPAGTSLALRAEDGETGVYNGEFELDRCGRLPPDGEVLALDRGLAVVQEGGEVVLVTLSGDERWRAPAVAAAHVAADGIVLGDDALLELRDVRDGEVLDQTTLVRPDTAGPATSGPVPWVWASDDRLLVHDDVALRPVDLATAALVVGDPVGVPSPDLPVADAVQTPGGVVALGLTLQETSALATDRGRGATTLPAGVAGLELHASGDGHVGLVVEVDGARALLVFGPDT